MRAHFPRCFVDVNREPYELDPRMFDGRLPSFANTRSMRVAGGLGTVARVVGDAQEIYDQRIPVDDALRRIEGLYKPYHRALRKLVTMDTVTVLTSSREKESSLEDQRWGHGAFTRAFLDALDGAADAQGRGMIRMGDLAMAMEAEVPKLTDQILTVRSWPPVTAYRPSASTACALTVAVCMPGSTASTGRS